MALYENNYKRRLVDVSRFGRDPLEDFQKLKERRPAEFFNQFFISNIFKECMNNRLLIIQNAILSFIQLLHNLIDLI